MQDYRGIGTALHNVIKPPLWLENDVVVRCIEIALQYFIYSPEKPPSLFLL